MARQRGSACARRRRILDEPRHCLAATRAVRRGDRRIPEGALARPVRDRRSGQSRQCAAALGRPRRRRGGAGSGAAPGTRRRRGAEQSRQPVQGAGPLRRRVRDLRGRTARGAGFPPGILEPARAHQAVDAPFAGGDLRAAPRLRRAPRARMARGLRAAGEHAGCRSPPAHRLRVSGLPCRIARVHRAGARQPRSKPLRDLRVLQQPEAAGRARKARAPRLARDEGRHRRRRRAVDPRRRHRHPDRHRGAHRAQPAGRVRPQTGPGAGHLARLSQHHRARRDRLPAHRLDQRPARRERRAPQRDPAATRAGAVVLASAGRGVDALAAARARRRPRPTHAGLVQRLLEAHRCDARTLVARARRGAGERRP